MDQSSRMPSRLGLLVGGSLVDPDAAVLHRSARRTGRVEDAVQLARQPGERSRQHRVRPYAGERLHLFTASRGDERDFRRNWCPYPSRAVLDSLDMAAPPPDDLGVDPPGSRRGGHNPDRTESGERQCAVPCHWRAQHPGRQCSDDLARTGHLARAVGATDRSKARSARSERSERSNRTGVVLSAVGCDRLPRAAGWPLPRDLDRSWRRSGGTHCAVSVDHLADRVQSVVCQAAPQQRF